MLSLDFLWNSMKAYELVPNALGIILVLTGMISILNQSLYFTYFWQLKEYRLDRMKDFLSSKSGKEKFFPMFWRVKMSLAIASIMLMFPTIPGLQNLQVLGVIVLIAIFGWGWEVVDIFRRYRSKKIYRPDKTVKALLITGLTVLFSVLILISFWSAYSDSQSSVGLVRFIALLWLVSSATLLINSLFVFFFWPVTSWQKQQMMDRAAQKIAKNEGLRVVAITGSYGKSSTKELLSAILESRFKVLKTPGNTNTDIGVAGVVMKSLTKEHEVFIVEAGAYKIGEIRKIVDLVKPRIGIITAVKDSHLGLFGSAENIRKAKYELIEGLPADGIAIFNSDSEGAEQLAVKAEKLKLSKVLRYSVCRSETNLVADKVVVGQEVVRFQLRGVSFELNACGAQTVYSALAAIAAALEMGMSLEEMVEPLKNAKLRDHTMSLRKINDGLWLIDDTYNANPDGVMAALEYLRQAYQDWQKIIVFPGMLELGDMSSQEHRRVASRISQVCDMAIFSSTDFKEDILGGLGSVAAKAIVLKKYLFIDGDQKQILSELRAAIKPKTVILFISRGADQVIKNLC